MSFSFNVCRARPHTKSPANHFKTTPLFKEKEKTTGGTQSGITVEHLVKHGLTEELNPHGASMGELQSHHVLSPVERVHCET